MIPERYLTLHHPSLKNLVRREVENMSHSQERQPFEFDQDTKLQSLILHAYLCAICHEPERPDDRFQYDHEIPIWFSREVGGALPCVIIKSLENCQPVHRTCHAEKHKTESRTELKEKAVDLLRRFLDKTVDPSRDDWRYKLKTVVTERR